MDAKLALQIVGVVLGLLYLWLEYHANVWLWVVGVVMPLVHGTLYLRSGLYADSMMQLYYVAAGVYGLAVWLRGTKRSDRAPLQITHVPAHLWGRIVGVYALLHVALYLLLRYCTDSTVPVWDAATTAMAVVAMWLLSRKYVEQWLVWLVADVITVFLYLYKDIPLTAALYALYCLLAVVGYRKWRSQARCEKA